MSDRKIPLGKPFLKKDIILKEIEKVLDRKWISGGPAITEFEEAVKKYNDDEQSHYVAVANATVGLELALLAINNGYRFKSEDEIIVPSWSWVASGFAVKNVGATPVWCDVNRWGVVEADHIGRLFTQKTKAVLIVHQMGIPCDIDAINKVCRKWCRYVPVVEDAACAFGSEYKGRKIGVDPSEIDFNEYGTSIGEPINTVVYSFQARKCLTTGEGGMVVTRNPALAAWVRSMRAFGTNVSPLERDSANKLLKENFKYIGTNYKMSDLQAALGIAHLKYFNEEISLRGQAAIRYNLAIAEMESGGYGIHRAFVRLPLYCTRYNWQNYHVLLDDCYDRDKAVDLMRKRNIGCKWDIQATHLEPAIRNEHVILPITEEYHKHGLWLPFYAEITEEDQKHVIQTLKEVLDLCQTV